MNHCHFKDYFSCNIASMPNWDGQLQKKLSSKLRYSKTNDRLWVADTLPYQSLNISLQVPFKRVEEMSPVAKVILRKPFVNYGKMSYQKICRWMLMEYLGQNRFETNFSDY